MKYLPSPLRSAFFSPRRVRTPAGKFGRDGQRLIGLAELDLRPVETALNQPRQARPAEAAENVVEQTVHLAMKRQEGIEIVARRREVLFP
ncbi:hypothetical protein XI03_34365 [Bradyrhizobium sp. CCBAU 65884]|nr:hypothetical protein [Bradyrhizobium sp. CCBAU 65884]